MRTAAELGAESKRSEAVRRDAEWLRVVEGARRDGAVTTDPRGLSTAGEKYGSSESSSDVADSGLCWLVDATDARWRALAVELDVEREWLWLCGLGQPDPLARWSSLYIEYIEKIASVESRPASLRCVGGDWVVSGLGGMSRRAGASMSTLEDKCHASYLFSSRQSPALSRPSPPPPSTCS